MDLSFIALPAAMFAGLLLADFASGFIHWVIDRYCDPRLPIAGPCFVGLIHEHHRRPHAMFGLSFTVNNAGFASLVGSIFLLFWLFGWLNPVTISAFVFGVFANQIHMWAHKRPKLGGTIVAALQRAGVLQSPRHHGRHHGPDPTAHYCLMTNFVNPIVDGIDLWGRLERLIERVFGVAPKFYVTPNPEFRLI